MVMLRMLLGDDPAEGLPDPYSSPLAFVIYVSVAVGLGSFAGICSGLTLGLLSMSRVDLEVHTHLLLRPSISILTHLIVTAPNKLPPELADRLG
jgi:hypothetical protein